jgi:hypothetical protein
MSTETITAPKLRGSQQALMERTAKGIRVRSWYVIELLHKRRWRPIGDEKGMFKFKTATARDKKLRELLAEQTQPA